MLSPIWISGVTRSGKTERLVQEFSQWLKTRLKTLKDTSAGVEQELTPSILVFAANDDNRRVLADKLAYSIQGSYPVICKTPLGFILEEVTLFWPLLFEQLHLKAQFPLRLRPETEQELATRLWLQEFRDTEAKLSGITQDRLIRNVLDLLQLAGASGTPAEDIPRILETGLEQTVATELWRDYGEWLLKWRQWCLERGLLTYGIVYQLYWLYLLPDPQYQHHLIRRYRAIFADDVDDYPAVARDLFTFFLDRGTFAVFTYNPQGQIRLGLNADPQYLEGLASRCQQEELPSHNPLADLVVNLVQEPSYGSLPDSIQSLQTISRAEMLRKTAEVVIEAIKQGEVTPDQIAIIAPGLDEIARYSLMEMLTHQGIPVEPLNEQRPLISSPLIRALLTLLALVYPGLGRLVARDAVAEMLVVLSRQPEGKEGKLTPLIDPVRAGLLADHCYFVDPQQPHLLPVDSFPRWDRLGYRATQAYQQIRKWLDETKALHPEQGGLSPILVLDRAINKFAFLGNNSAYEQISALRDGDWQRSYPVVVVE